MEKESAEEEVSDAASGVIVLVVILVIGAVLFFAVGAGGGSTVGRIAMSPQPQAVTVAVDAAGTLQVWADVEITHREFSPSIAAVKLPHVMDYIVDLKQPDGQTLRQRCNPFNTNFMLRSDEYNSIGQDAGRRYDGLIRGCAFKVTPGTYHVTAHLEAVKPDSRITLQKNDLVLRLDD